MTTIDRHRRRGFWRWILLVTEWVVLVVGTLVVAALLSLQLRIVRHFVGHQVNRVLADTFAGRVVIEKVDRLSLMGLGGARVRVFDPGGTEVLLVDNADVSIATFDIVRSFLKKEGDLVIDIPEVTLTYVDANLDSDAQGNLKLLQAFSPKEVTTKEPSGSRATVIHLRKIALAHAWTHGQIEGAPLIDVDLDKLDLSLIVGGDRTVADLATLDITARSLPQGLGLNAHLEAHYAEPAPNGGERAARIDLQGHASGVPLSLRGSIDGADVSADFDIPKVTPEDVRRVAPDSQVTQDLTAHAEVRGHLPDITAKAHFGAGAGVLDILARATIAEEKKLHATIHAENLDARALSRTAPATRLGLDVRVDAKMDAKGGLQGAYAVEVPSGDIGGNLVPATHLEGNVTKSGSSDEAATLHVAGKADIDEPGARTALRFDVTQGAGPMTVDFRVNTVAPKLNRTRVGNQLAGSANLDARGKVTVGQTTKLDATVNLQASNVVSSEARVARAELRASVNGNVDDPMAGNVDLDFKATGLAAADMSFTHASIELRGSSQGADLVASLVPNDGPHIDATTRIALGQGVSLRNTCVEVARDDITALLRVAGVRLAGSRLRVDDVSLEGVGETLRADVSKTDRELVVRAESAGVDLEKIGRLFRRRDLRGGRLALDVDLALRKTSATGHLRAKLQDGAFQRIKNGTADIDTNFDGRRVDANIHAMLGDIGRLDIDKGHVEVDGNAPLDVNSLEKAHGALAVDSRLNLTRIRALLPRGVLPFTDMQGVVELKGNIARESTAEPPELNLSVATRGLALSGRGDPEDRERVAGTRIDPTPPWSIEGVDLEMTAGVAKDDGATTLQGRVFDRQGTIVSVDANTDAMPYRQWLKTKKVDTSKLRDLRWAAQVAIPRRELKKFPAAFKTRQMGGSIGASVRFEGTLAEPDLRLVFEANQWVAPIPRGMHPINAKVDARYQKNEGAVDLAVSTRDKELLNGTVELKGALPGLGDSESSSADAWRASTKMRIAEFPLETLGTFSDFQVKGYVSGDIDVADVHRDARAKVNVALRDLKLGRAKIAKGNIKIDYDGHALKGGVRLDQTDGYLESDAEIAMRWGAETAPSVITEEPAYAALKANRFRAAALAPFITDVVSQLDGRLQADARIDIVPGAAPKLKGQIALEEGRMQLTRVGEPLHGVTAKIALSPDGVVRLEDLTAQGSSGRINAKAVVRLNGFQLTGARASVRIPKNDPFPFDVDGQAIGEIDGAIDVTADMTPDQKQMNVKVDIPRLHTQLPLASSNSPQELGEAEKIRVGYFRRARQFVELPKDAEDLRETSNEEEEKATTTINVAIHLGNDIEVRRGTSLRIALTGDPKIQIAEEAKMSGQIRLTRGMLEVQGRRFEIEKGVVTFVGPPDNPQVMVTAAWDAPDGTRVYADFVGPLKTGKVTLRSEPSRPQNEILALIMFGTAEGSSSTPYPTQQPDGATRAGAMAGGFATEGLSKGLDELTGLDVSAKIDTSNAANPKPQVEVQIARDISMQIAYVLGTPPPGMNPDRTYLTLDWRFRRNWSMETTFGDQGSSILDLLWQYRY